jgi:hypothetical protein
VCCVRWEKDTFGPGRVADLLRFSRRSEARNYSILLVPVGVVSHRCHRMLSLFLLKTLV